MKVTKRFFGVIATIMTEDQNTFFDAIKEARKLGVTTLELRLDPFGDSVGEMSELLKRIPEAIGRHQTILTLRSKAEGGARHIDDFRQFEFWSGLPDPLWKTVADPESDVVVDWDQRMVGMVCQMAPSMPFPWAKIGCSWHYLNQSGSYEVYAARRLRWMENMPAWAFLKMALYIHNDIQLTELEHCLLANHADTRPLIAFGMGPLGQASRFKCLEWGSAGTYGYIPGLQPAAPGQVPVTELLECPGIRELLLKRAAMQESDDGR